jgi:hypothetical protein
MCAHVRTNALKVGFKIGKCLLFEQPAFSCSIDDNSTSLALAETFGGAYARLRLAILHERKSTVHLGTANKLLALEICTCSLKGCDNCVVVLLRLQPYAAKP